MKHVFSIALCALSVTACRTEPTDYGQAAAPAPTTINPATDRMPWIEDATRAFTIAGAQKRGVAVLVTAPNCDACLALEKALDAGAVRDSLERKFMPLIVRGGDAPPARELGVTTVPTLIFVTNNKTELARLTTPLPEAELLAIIAQAKATLAASR